MDKGSLCISLPFLSWIIKGSAYSLAIITFLFKTYRLSIIYKLSKNILIYYFWPKINTGTKMLKINYNITYKTTTVKVNSKMIPDFMNPVTFWSGHLLNDIKKVYCKLSLIYCCSLTKIYCLSNFFKRLGSKGLEHEQECPCCIPSIL